MKKLIIVSITLFCTIAVMAQNPAVGKKNTGIIAFTNAKIFVGNGIEIDNGTLVIENNKIIDVGQNIDLIKFTGVQKIDVGGKHIYPGIISPNNSLGLTEIQSVRTTSDFSEIGKFNPNVRTLIAFNTDSEVIPTVRSNGVLISQATPEGGIISGRSSIFNLDGWNWEDAVLKPDDGVWLNWPSKLTSSFDFTTFTRDVKKNENYQTEVTELNELFNQSKVQKNASNVYENLKLSALNGVFSGNDRLYVSINDDKEALDAIAFSKNQNVKFMVLVGAVKSELVINQLKENNIPILIPTTHRLPGNADIDIWEAYKLPFKLMAKGILVGMYYNESYWRTRNLPFVAGNAAGHGLTKAQALSMITINNAKILGIDHMVGTLEKGKLATFFVSKGDVLDMKTALVEKAFINGQEVILDDKQKRLAQKYYEKYGIK
jgi:imidazolonepropionase-like amidohydrolase